jgi:hypothetical protein
MTEICEKLKKLELDQTEIKNKLQNLEERVDKYQNQLTKVNISKFLFE